MSTKVFNKIYFSNSPGETKKLGRQLAAAILKKPSSEKAVLIGLEGELGGGKTTFVQGLSRGLGLSQKVLSPTFVLIRKFQMSKSKCQIKSKAQRAKFRYFYHIDCYRIEDPKELLDLGLKEIISEPTNIVCIEWAEKIKKILPRKTIWLKFQSKNQNQREINIEDHPKGQARDGRGTGPF